MYNKLVISFLLCTTIIFSAPNNIDLNYDAFTCFLFKRYTDIKNSKTVGESKRYLIMRTIDSIFVGGSFDNLDPIVREEAIRLLREFNA